jgi:hypothetical protein
MLDFLREADLLLVAMRESYRKYGCKYMLIDKIIRLGIFVVADS